MDLQNLWKFKTPDEQLAYQEGYTDAKQKMRREANEKERHLQFVIDLQKGDFKYGLFTGFFFSFIAFIISLTFKLYM